MSKSSQVVTLSVREQKAIDSLHRLAKRWPQTLSLFSWSGSLHVIKDGATIDTVIGIENDGGDADHTINQEAEIEYE